MAGLLRGSLKSVIGVPRSSLAVGVGGAILGSLCCALPAAAFAAGLGGLSSLVALTQYQRLFEVASLFLVAGSSWYLSRRRAHCCRTAAERRSMLIAIITTATVAYLVIYLVIERLVIPLMYGMTPSLNMN